MKRYLNGQLVNVPAHEEAEKLAARAAIVEPSREIPKWVISERLGGARLVTMDAYFEQGLPREAAIMHRERWRAGAFPNVQVDSPDMLALLGQVLGLDADQITELLRPYDPTNANALDVIA